MKIHAEIFSNASCLPAIYKITALPVDSGSIVITPNKTLYSFGDVVTFQAIPDSGYNFLTWKGDSILKTASIQLTVTKDIYLVARFNKTQTVQVLISDGDLVHSAKVQTAFEQGYFDACGNVFSGSIETRISLLDDTAYQYADSKGVEIIIRSTTGAQYLFLRSQLYYPINLLMPVSNTHTQLIDTGGILPSLILTGTGTVNNINGYDIEHFNIDPFGTNLSSFSNPYLAGIFVAASDNGFNKDYSAIRYYAKKGKTWTSENGFGKLLYSDIVNITNLNEFNANILIDPDYYRKLDLYLQQ